MSDDLPRPKSHADLGHPEAIGYQLDQLRQHLIIDHGQRPEGVNHVAPNLLVAMHDSGSFGEHRMRAEREAAARAVVQPDPNEGSTSSFAEREKDKRIEALEAELLELRTGLEMMAIGMRAMENELRNHVTSGPHHSHPER